MKKIVLRFGLYSSLTIVALFLLSWIIFHDTNFAAQEVFGYSSMVLALLFVFFGIKQYRDTVNQGSLTFGKGMKVGLLIVLLASTALGLFDVVYILYINPGFFDKYYSFQLAQAQQTMPPAELESWKKDLEASKALMQNPVMNFLFMFAMAFVIGVIISVISSLILMRKPKPSFG